MMATELERFRRSGLLFDSVLAFYSRFPEVGSSFACFAIYEVLIVQGGYSATAPLLHQSGFDGLGGVSGDRPNAGGSGTNCERPRTG